MPGLGLKSFAQIGKETTYGTPVVATEKSELISSDIVPVVGVIDDPSLSDAVSRRGLFQGGLLYRGPLVLRLNYEGKFFLKLLNALMGGTPTDTLVETAISWDHIFKESALLPSYTIELGEGDIPTTKCSDLEGVKVTAATFRGTAGQGAEGMLTAEFEILAKNKQMNQTPATLTFPSAQPAIFHQALTVDDGTADVPKIRSFEVSVRNNLAEDRFYLGNVNIDEPIRNDFLEVTWRITQEFQTMTQFNNAKAFTDESPQLVFRGAALGANFYEFEVKSGFAKVVEHSQPIQGYGVMLATTTLRAYNNGTGDNTAVYLRVRNGQSTV